MRGVRLESAVIVVGPFFETLVHHRALRIWKVGRFGWQSSGSEADATISTRPLSAYTIFADMQAGEKSDRSAIPGGPQGVECFGSVGKGVQ